MKDYYKILGVPFSASQKEIEEAFFKLKAKFTSDDLDDPFLKTYYRKVLEAHNVLSNPFQKTRYDLRYRDDPKSSPEEKTPVQVPPQIMRFRSSSPTFENNKAVEIEWRTKNSTYVEIEPFGKVDTSGKKEFNLPIGNEVRILLTLKAKNSDGTLSVSKSISIQRKEELNLTESAVPQDPVKPAPLKEKDEIQREEYKTRRGKTTVPETEVQKKYNYIPIGILIFLICGGLFFLYQKYSFQGLQSELITDLNNQTLKKPTDPDLPVTSEVHPYEHFGPSTTLFNGEEFTVYDPLIVLKQLITELENNSLPDQPRLRSELAPFLTGTPLAWKELVYSPENSHFSAYEGKTFIGLKQEAYYSQEKLILDQLQVKKYGKNNGGSSQLEKISLIAWDSGPPFWLNDGTTKALEKLFSQEIKQLKLIAPDSGDEVLVTEWNEIGNGQHYGYLITSKDYVIPVNITKTAGEYISTSLQIDFYSSMNGLQEKVGTELDPEEVLFKVRNLLKAEDTKDFYLVSSFYSDTVERYWDIANADCKTINEAYKSAWLLSPYSSNHILNMETINEFTVEVSTEFTFSDTHGDTITKFSTIRYIFDNRGLITQVYPVSSSTLFKAFQDPDFDQIGIEEKIMRLVDAENKRNFYKAASFYSGTVDRFFNSTHLDFSGLQRNYESSWNASAVSSTLVLGMQEVDTNFWKVTLAYEMEDKSIREEGLRIMRFDEEGLIKEVYNIEF